MRSVSERKTKKPLTPTKRWTITAVIFVVICLLSSLAGKEGLFNAAVLLCVFSVCFLFVSAVLWVIGKIAKKHFAVTSWTLQALAVLVVSFILTGITVEPTSAPILDDETSTEETETTEEFEAIEETETIFEEPTAYTPTKDKTSETANSDDNNTALGTSNLAIAMGLSVKQEEAVLELFTDCGIGEITEASLFKEYEASSSYYLEDKETEFYQGADYAIVVWVNNETKEIEAIYYHDEDIYVDGVVCGWLPDYYISSEQRDNYRVASQLAIEKLLSNPKSAKFPSISGWNFKVSDNGEHIVSSTVTAKNQYGITSTLEFQTTFTNEVLTSLILDGVKYL